MNKIQWSHPEAIAITTKSDFWERRLRRDFFVDVENGESPRYKYMKYWITNESPRERHRLEERLKHRYVISGRNYRIVGVEMASKDKWAIMFYPCDFWGCQVSGDRIVDFIDIKISDTRFAQITVLDHYNKLPNPIAVRGVCNDRGFMMTEKWSKDVWKVNPNIDSMMQIAYMIPTTDTTYSVHRRPTFCRDLNGHWVKITPITPKSSIFMLGDEYMSLCSVGK